jgi:hypothetical protein
MHIYNISIHTQLSTSKFSIIINHYIFDDISFYKELLNNERKNLYVFYYHNENS